MGKDKKGEKKLASYAIVLILMVIIVIIIASMADDRERTFQTQIDKTTQTNMTIQDEIVALKDENYNLKQQIDTLQPQAENNDKVAEQLPILNEIIQLFNDGKTEEANAKYAEINSAEISETLIELYNSIGEIIAVQ